MDELINSLFSSSQSDVMINEIDKKIDFYKLKYYKKYVIKLIHSMNEKEFKDFHNKATSNKTARTFEKFLFKYFYKHSIEFVKKEDFNKTKNKEPKEAIKKRVERYRENNKDLKSLQLMVSPHVKHAFDMVRKENKLTGNQVLTHLLIKSGFLK